jgi:hypothetical protein
MENPGNRLRPSSWPIDSRNRGRHWTELNKLLLSPINRAEDELRQPRVARHFDLLADQRIGTEPEHEFGFELGAHHAGALFEQQPARLWADRHLRLLVRSAVPERTEICRQQSISCVQPALSYSSSRFQ